MYYIVFYCKHVPQFQIYEYSPTTVSTYKKIGVLCYLLRARQVEGLMPFSNSTHARNWIFTSQELVELREKCDLVSRGRLKAGIEPLSMQEQNIFNFTVCE